MEAVVKKDNNTVGKKNNQTNPKQKKKDVV